MNEAGERREPPPPAPGEGAAPEGVLGSALLGSESVPSILPLVAGPPPEPLVVSAVDARPPLPVDSGLAGLDAAVSAADWPAVARLLGPAEASSSLPPALGLLYAIALKETDLPISEADREQGGPTQLAIRSMAALLGLPVSSPLPLVIAKRLLRSNPVSWRERRAPPMGKSLVIVLLGILAGLAVGYAVSAGIIRVELPGWR